MAIFHRMSCMHGPQGFAGPCKYTRVDTLARFRRSLECRLQGSLTIIEVTKRKRVEV